MPGFSQNWREWPRGSTTVSRWRAAYLWAVIADENGLWAVIAGEKGLREVITGEDGQDW